ncbi:MAG: SDR family oxidoreductase [Oscillospiraceae bacterium]|nr:SDR family oxidoreductase [Oscillospiraceae bacterium]
MKKSAIIIGANSYIARNMIHVLSECKDVEAVALYDCQSTHDDGAANYKQINILDEASFTDVDLDVDLIFFFAGKTGTAVSFDNYDMFIDVNEKSLLNLLSEYRKQQSRAKIIFPSSRLVYKGKEGLLSEDSEKEFKTVYAINKFACEQYLSMYAAAFGVRYCIFRVCVPYGTLVPGASSYGTAEFMLERAKSGENITLYGNGSVRRTLTYIEDLCETMLLGALSLKCENDVFNIGGENYSLFEMASFIAERYKVAIEFEEWPELALRIESGDTVFDSGKLYGCLACQGDTPPGRNVPIDAMTFEKWILQD